MNRWILRLEASGAGRSSHGVGYDTKSWSAMRATRPLGTPERAFLREFQRIAVRNFRSAPHDGCKRSLKSFFSKKQVDRSGLTRIEGANSPDIRLVGGDSPKFEPRPRRLGKLSLQDRRTATLWGFLGASSGCARLTLAWTAGASSAERKV